MNRDKARELLEKELRIRPTVKASAIFTGKNGSNVRCVRQGRELSREEIAGIFDPDEEGGGQE